MRRVQLDHPSVDGAVLVRDVRGPSGDVLARAGMRLSPRAARALREHGVAVAFIEDAACVGLDIRPLVDVHGPDQSLARAMRDALDLASKAVGPLPQQPTSRALLALKEVRFVPVMDTTGAMEALRGAVHMLVERVRDADPASGFLSERQPADDLLGHSLGVAALAVRLAADLGFSHGDIVWTGLAGVVHDLGLLMVPEDVRRTPAELRTAGQQRRYEDHAVLGSALLKPLQKRAPALPLVAVEHHEEQSGGGYPSGMTGATASCETQPPRCRASRSSQRSSRWLTATSVSSRARRDTRRSQPLPPATSSPARPVRRSTPRSSAASST